MTTINRGPSAGQAEHLYDTDLITAQPPTLRLGSTFRPRKTSHRPRNAKRVFAEWHSRFYLEIGMSATGMRLPALTSVKDLEPNPVDRSPPGYRWERSVLG
jgi:hypothetical protein